MSPVSYWGISGYVVFWVLLALAVGLFLRRIYQLGRYLSLGKGEEKFGQMVRRGSTPQSWYWDSGASLRT